MAMHWRPRCAAHSLTAISGPSSAPSSGPGPSTAQGPGHQQLSPATLTFHVASTSRLGDLRSRCTMPFLCLQVGSEGQPRQRGEGGLAGRHGTSGCAANRAGPFWTPCLHCTPPCSRPTAPRLHSQVQHALCGIQRHVEAAQPGEVLHLSRGALGGTQHICQRAPRAVLCAGG